MVYQEKGKRGCLPMLPGEKQKPIRLIFLILILFLCSLPIIPGIPGVIPVSASDSPATVLGIYMIGSDLEYDSRLSFDENALRKEHATRDIREMITGWGTGSDKLEVLVAYGGAEKEGWTGMTVATIGMLMADDADGVIGNSPAGYLIRTDTDMNSKEGLVKFLTYLSENYPNSKKIIILWDHGSAYFGFGKDPVTMRRISAVDLRDAFAGSGAFFEVIGFDACFMADIEIMRLLSPYGNFFLASEDIEPEHGWNYSIVVSELMQDQEWDPVQYGKRVIDAYMDDPGHQKGSLSLSLVDLGNINAFLSSFDSFSSQLESMSQEGEYPALSRMIGRLNGIGRAKGPDGEDTELMVDLYSLLRIAGEEIPDLDGGSDLLSLLDECIVYARHDTPTSQMHGIGVFPPLMVSHPWVSDSVATGTVLDISRSWIGFMTSFSDLLAADTVPPVIEKTDEGFMVSEDGYVMVTDLFLQFRPDGSQVILGQEPSFVDESNHIRIPDWGGTTTHLTDGTTSSLLPVYYVETTDSGTQLYYAWGFLGQGDPKQYTKIRMDIWYNPTIHAVSWVIRPYSILSDGRMEFERTAVLYPGDEIIVFSVIQNPDGSNEFQEVGKVLWGEDVKIVQLPLPCGEYGIQVVASDLAGNSNYSEVIGYDIPC